MFGYYAAGWVNLFSYMLLALLHYLLMRRICRVHHIAGGILDERFLAAVSAGIFSDVFCGYGALYRLGNVRYLVLLLIIAAVCFSRKKLYRLLRQIRKGETNEG